MAKYAIADFTRYDIGDVNAASKSKLEAAVRRAAKAANNRLRALEKADRRVGAYKRASIDLGLDRPRFRERVATMSLGGLRQEYKILKKFLSSPSSTISGQMKVGEARYNTAVSRGYKGTLDQFIIDVQHVFSASFASKVASNILYRILLSGDTDIIDEILEAEHTVSDIENRLYKRYIDRLKQRQQEVDRRD